MEIGGSFPTGQVAGASDHSSPSGSDVGVECTKPEHPHMLSRLGDEEFYFCLVMLLD